MWHFPPMATILSGRQAFMYQPLWRQLRHSRPEEEFRVPINDDQHQYSNFGDAISGDPVSWQTGFYNRHAHPYTESLSHKTVMR
jgi:hypothetical protein